MAKLRGIFGRNVRARYAALGLTQAGAAKRCGIAAPQFSDYITGKKSPGLDVLERIAAGLSTTTSALLDDGREPAPIEVDHPLEVCVKRVSEAALGARRGGGDAPPEAHAILERMGRAKSDEEFDAIEAELIAYLERTRATRAG